MLYEMEELPDAAIIYTFVATRSLKEEEQRAFLDLINSWIMEWIQSFPMCLASHSYVLLNGSLFFFAIDDLPRSAKSIARGLSGTDLDPLFNARDVFVAHAHPPVAIEHNDAVLVGGRVVALSPELAHLLTAGQITRDTLVARGGCTMAEVRAWGGVLHPLRLDPSYAHALLGNQADKDM